MSKGDRYDVSGLAEAQFEPGSDHRVLRNRHGIKSRQQMDHKEARALEKTMDQIVKVYDEDHRFTAADIRELHRIWLGDIYEWAGTYRQTNISKDGFPFAAATRVPALMEELERESLRRRTPCKFKDQAEVARALAEVHTELVLIHPFREGNGRLARMLSTLMALQSGLPLLNFSQIAVEKKRDYFAAVQAGMEKEYRPMEEIFSSIIGQSLGDS